MDIHKKRFDSKLIYVNFIMAYSIVVLHVINFSPTFHTNITYIQTVWSVVSNIANIVVPCFFCDIRIFVLL